MNDYILMTYYMRYLKDIRKLSDSSINHYTQALRKISSILKERGKIVETIYEIQDIGELEIIRAYLFSDYAFTELDKRGHNMYSAGLNNYYKFALGENFNDLKKEMKILDIEMPVQVNIQRNVVTRSRSSIIKVQSIETANYECELYPEHITFVSKSSGRQYMEGHHAIPMKHQNKFSNSLDVYANIICLCPNCHRMLHYGLDADKSSALSRIYYDRVDRLAHSGIRLSKEEFIDFAV